MDQSGSPRWLVSSDPGFTHGRRNGLHRQDELHGQRHRRCRGHTSLVPITTLSSRSVDLGRRRRDCGRSRIPPRRFQTPRNGWSNLFVRDMDLGVPNANDNRRLEVVVACSCGVFVGSPSSLVQQRGLLPLHCWNSAEVMGWTVTRTLTMRLSGISTTQGCAGERWSVVARDSL